MKKILLLLSCAFVFFHAPAQKAKYVVLVTIDGFRPEFYLDPSWSMVNLRHLMQNGVAARQVYPVFPSVTYPDHTTMITGVTPAKHGIYYNTPFEATGQTGKWYWNYHLIKSETLWDAMHKAGKTTACVGWPVTVDAPIDYRIPEIWELKNKDARGITARETAPARLWQEVQDSSTGYLGPNDLTDAEDNELVSDENKARAAGYIIRQYKPNFMAVHLSCVDHYEHQEGRDAYIVRAAVAGADRAVKSILESINRAGIADSTVIIVTGDHGFENIYRTLNPNYLLKKNGLRNNIKTGDWKAQFLQSGGSAFLHLKNQGDTQTLHAVKRILENVPDSLKSYFAIVEKEKLTQIGADPTVSLAITGLNGTSFGATDKTLLKVLDKVKGTHGFFPDHKEIMTGFVASGVGLKKNIVIPEMKLLDLCPLIVQLTGIVFPRTDGKTPADFLSSVQ